MSNAAAVTPAKPATTFLRAAPSLLERFRALPAANVGDAMERLGVIDPAIHAVWPGARLVGSAFTVWTRSGDNLVVHQAIDLAAPGDVIVVNGGGDASRALVGELMGTRAKVRGLAGYVIDGAIRDAMDLGAMALPVFARGSSPAGPYKNGPGKLLTAIAVGGVCVRPGDVLVADGDGVVVVPLEEAEDVLTRAEEIHRTEAAKRASYLRTTGRGGS